MLRSFLDYAVPRLPRRVKIALFQRILYSLSPEAKFSLGVPDMFGALVNMKRQGLAPLTVVDIGAFRGEWSKEVGKIFPNAAFHLFEPQPGKLPALNELKQSSSFPIRIHPVLLGATPVDAIPFHVMETGSSVLPEKTSFPRETIHLPMHTLDERLAIDPLAGGILLKLDVQGYELEVLSGASQTLLQTEVILLEVALLEFNQGAPLLAEVIAFLAQRGFLVYDFGGMARRQADRTLFQTDIFFVRADHPLRAHKPFWLNEP